MSTHNICFHGEIRKISVLFWSCLPVLWVNTVYMEKYKMNDKALAYPENLLCMSLTCFAVSPIWSNACNMKNSSI